MRRCIVSASAGERCLDDVNHNCKYVSASVEYSRLALLPSNGLDSVGDTQMHYVMEMYSVKHLVLLDILNKELIPP